MNKMELKEISIEKIYPNWFQPRKEFEKEKIKELAESILSNGLINPITVKSWREGKYLIVSGERRWRAHKIAGLKTIQTFVKEYKDDGQFMIDSLIENIHREDLTPTEKGKFCKRIMKQAGIKTQTELAKKLSSKQSDIEFWFDVLEGRKEMKGITAAVNLSDSAIAETKGLSKKDKIALIQKAAKEDFGKMKVREYKNIMIKSDEPTKKALLSGRVTIEDVKKESIPEPIKNEITANDVVNNILSNLHDFKYNVDLLLKNKGKQQINIEDLRKSLADRAITTAGLHLKVFKDFVNALRQRGAKPDKYILALIRANGKQ